MFLSGLQGLRQEPWEGINSQQPETMFKMNSIYPRTQKGDKERAGEGQLQRSHPTAELSAPFFVTKG